MNNRLLLVALAMLSLGVNAQEGVETLYSECTTTEKIYYTENFTLPDDLNKHNFRDAVYYALGNVYSAADGGFISDQKAGEWYYESEADDVIYAGIDIRQHYLQVAISYSDDRLESVVCDSRNLKQSNRSIHRKVPGWKATLDAEIRMALRRAASAETIKDTQGGAGGRSAVSAITELERLDKLRDQGVISAAEFDLLKAELLEELGGD